MKKMAVILFACLFFVSCGNQAINSTSVLSSNSPEQPISSSAVNSGSAIDSLPSIPEQPEQEDWDYSTLDAYAVDGSGEATIVASFTPCDTRIKSIEVLGFIGGGNSGDNGINIVLYDFINWTDLSTDERGILAHEVLKSVERTMSGYNNLYFGTQGSTEDGTMIFNNGGIASDGKSITLWDGTGSYEDENTQFVLRSEMEERIKETD